MTARRPPQLLQLPLFPDQAALTRIRPEANEWRFYRMEVWPDLFGRALLLRHWGRIGTEGRRRLDPHPDPGAACNALALLVREKRRRGYLPRVFSALFAAWLAWGGPVQAADCSANASQAELTQCAGKDAHQADAALNAVYRTLLGKIDAASQARLRTAQRAWISFRDTECTFETGGGANQGGTIWPMLVDQCVAKLTRARTHALQAQLKCQSWDLACPGG